mmetsp:Transcript_26940/g.62630  ORF Transcript_26940/g.62630 Transcript_26940/m.62630 type:complete len:219 (-) Transcript_26940:372-1028(-)
MSTASPNMPLLNQSLRTFLPCRLPYMDHPSLEHLLEWSRTAQEACLCPYLRMVHQSQIHPSCLVRHPSELPSCLHKDLLACRHKGLPAFRRKGLPAFRRKGLLACLLAFPFHPFWAYRRGRHPFLGLPFLAFQTFQASAYHHRHQNQAFSELLDLACQLHLVTLAFRPFLADQLHRQASSELPNLAGLLLRAILACPAASADLAGPLPLPQAALGLAA